MTFSEVIAFFRLNVPVSLISDDEAPIKTSYLPASATQAEAAVLNEERSLALRFRVIVCDSPGCNNLVLAKVRKNIVALLSN